MKSILALAALFIVTLGVASGQGSLGNMALQNKNAVDITGGSVTGVTGVQPASANLTEYAGVNPSADALTMMAAVDFAAIRALLGVTPASDTAFASSWNAVTTISPSKNAVYDWAHIFDTDDDGKVNVLDIGAGIPKTDSGGVVSLATAGTDYAVPSDTAYDATSWNGNTDVPTKNAVRDKIETLGTGAYQPQTVLTGTANQVNVSNGGVGATTVSTPQDIATSSSPQFAGINLGHASDTTLGRTSAGVVNVEGSDIFTAATKTDVLQAATFAADAGSNDTYVATLSPAPSGYVTGVHYRFKANTANTGACTIDFNSLGAKTIKKASGGLTTDLADNDIRSGQWVDLVYDGTNMQMQSTLGNAAGGGGGLGGSTGSTDNAILRADGTGGSTAQASTATLSDTGDLTLSPSSDSGATQTIKAASGNKVIQMGTYGGFPSYGTLHFGNITPDGTNHTIISDGSDTTLNSAGTLQFRIGHSNTGRMYFSSADSGLFKFYGTVLEFEARSSGGTPGTDCARLYSKDVAGTAEIFVMDEAGNETQISPHNHTAPASFVDSDFDVIGYESNAYTGLVTYTNKSRQLAGRADSVLIETFAEHNTRLSLTGDAALVQLDWATVQAAHVAKRDAERAAWAQRKATWEADPKHADIPFAETQPALYVAKPVPAWLTAQLNGRAAYLARRDTIASQSSDRLTKRGNVAGSVAALRQWKADADASVAGWDAASQATKFATMKVVIQRFGTLCDRLADLIQAQGIDQ